jgi:hypothetical protein
MAETFSVVSVDIAMSLVTAIKGTDNFVILNRYAGEEFNGQPSSVLVYECVETGAIYTLPYFVEDYGNGTSGVHLLNGSVQLEGHGDIMYTPVKKISDVPDTIESLFA